MLWQHILLTAGTLGLVTAQGNNGASSLMAMNGQKGTKTGSVSAQTGTAHTKGKGGASVPADLSGGFKAEEITIEVIFKEKKGKGKHGKGKGKGEGEGGNKTSAAAQSPTSSGANAQLTPSHKSKGKGKSGMLKLSGKSLTRPLPSQTDTWSRYPATAHVPARQRQQHQRAGQIRHHDGRHHLLQSYPALCALRLSSKQQRHSGIHFAATDGMDGSRHTRGQGRHASILLPDVPAEWHILRQRHAAAGPGRQRSAVCPAEWPTEGSGW